MNLYKKAMKTMAAAVLICSCCSCIYQDYELGSNLLATEDQFDFYTAEIPLENIEMRMADSLSGYSQTRITFGAVKDPDFGITTRSSAITIVPMRDSLDFGAEAEFESFRLILDRDTMSLASEADRYMLQNINVYELTEAIDTTYDINSKIKHGDKRVTKNIPVYNGYEDTLSFIFTKEFGEKYMGITLEDTKDIRTFTKKFPGIYVTTDVPANDGGRINMFTLQLHTNTSYYLIGNYAELKFNARYDGERKDTSFLFYLCPDRLYDVDSLLYNSTGNLPQYCLNISSQESAHLGGKATDKIYVEGGGGLKPVISATELKEKFIAEISKHGDPATALINKASLIFPFEFPENYEDMTTYPQILNPTCRVRANGRLSFGGLTDSSASDEDQGDVNRSLLVYAPDITYHAQTILGLDENAEFSNYDVWLLIMANEVEKEREDKTQSDAQQEYYNKLMYSNYYNSMYGGYGYGGYGYPYGGYGYGGYGGYGYGGYGYNDYYSNYYSFMLMQQYYNSANSSSQAATSAMLDKDRYYHAVLRGPEDPVAHPTIRITYAIPKE